jgi:hypothetical protein
MRVLTDQVGEEFKGLDVFGGKRLRPYRSVSYRRLSLLILVVERFLGIRIGSPPISM